jgi:biotin synthesis protein BioG
MKTYRKIVVIGWSLGVWAAEYLSASTGIVPDVTIAVNGTPVPLDDHYGIPAHSFEEALNNITEESMDKFYYRMFGNRRTYNLNSEKIPQRTLESVHVEMRWLYNRIMEQKDPGFRWDYAVTSESDRIFPSENVISYWNRQKNTRQIIVPYPHFMFYKWNSYADFINYVEKKGSKISGIPKIHSDSIKGL